MENLSRILNQHHFVAGMRFFSSSKMLANSSARYLGACCFFAEDIAYLALSFFSRLLCSGHMAYRGSYYRWRNQRTWQQYQFISVYMYNFTGRKVALTSLDIFYKKR